MSTSRGIFHPALRVYQIWGTRQDVGKTVFSTALCYSAARAKRAKGAHDHVGFLKPLSIGALDESEHTRVLRFFRQLMRGKTMPIWFRSESIFHRPSLVSQASPDTPDVSDKDLLKGIQDYAAKQAEGIQPPGGWLFIETLNDVESLLPSGNRQADVYRPLQLPGILVGDAKQGGVDETISAYESLRRRDHDIQAVAVFKDPDSENHLRLSDHFKELGVPLLAVRPIPERLPDERRNRNLMIHYYRAMGRSNSFKDLLKTLYSQHNQRAKALDPQTSDTTEETPHSPEADQSVTVWDRELEFSFVTPGKHKHKI